ncbi:MAG: N-formylglutamate amidohydrolase [Deltaproteobacteria bacterium]|nr:N-formylglutamate amidohydrolase [Deltaproteobacteria bacterium]
MKTRSNRSPLLKELLVVVPHSGIAIPAEIRLDTLSVQFGDLIRHVDWYTNWLYEFRDILANQQIVFPYCSLIVEANRHPEVLDDAVPLRDVNGEPVYKPGAEPGQDMRRLLAHKYLVDFHKRIEQAIASGAEFLLDGHSTVAARGVAENQIDLMNFQHSKLDNGPLYYSPAAYIESYAEELQKRLPDVKVTVNQSEYYTVYGHVCAEHSVNSFGRVGRRVPAIIQETCERLYKNADRTPNVEAIDRLRRAFAESIRETIHRVRDLKKPARTIRLPSLRQTYDFDCGVKALQTVFAYYGTEIREDKLLLELEADRQEGTSVGNMIAAAEARGFKVEAGEHWSVEDVKRYVDQGHPVIVLLQAWAEEVKSLEDWRRDWDDGHYAIVMGYNENVLFFEDPASFHRTWLREKEFLARWHDLDTVNGRKWVQFGMVLLGKESAGAALMHME